MADVSLKIIDSQTGQPFPCWINLTKVTGENVAPTGWDSEIPTGPGMDVGGRVALVGKTWFAISGECELPGNQGECLLKVSRAPGFQWVDHPINLFAGRLAVRLSVSITDSGNSEGFIAADFRTHSISAGGALLEARAGNLQLVQVVACQAIPGDGKTTNLAPLAEAAGLSNQVLKGGCLVSWGTLNTQSDSGNLVLLDCHRPVFPLAIDKANAGAWSVMDWTAQCHRIRGVTIWADCSRDQGHQAEAICAALEGEIDCFEVTNLCEKRSGGLALWYALAGAGIFIPLVGASAKDSNAVPVGYLRTLIPVQGGIGAFTREARNAQEAWVTGIKSGYSAVTRFPFFFTREIQSKTDSCRLKTEIGPLHGQVLLEWVQPNGQVLSSKTIFPQTENQVMVSEISGKLPCRVAARLRSDSGELIAHESFQRVRHPNLREAENRAPIARQIANRLQEGIQWVDQISGSNPEGEMAYRKDLFSKWLAKFKEMGID